mgnify:CR=1 FL=1
MLSFSKHTYDWFLKAKAMTEQNTQNVPLLVGVWAHMGWLSLSVSGHTRCPSLSVPLLTHRLLVLPVIQQLVDNKHIQPGPVFLFFVLKIKDSENNTPRMDLYWWSAKYMFYNTLYLFRNINSGLYMYVVRLVSLRIFYLCLGPLYLKQRASVILTSVILTTERSI